MKRISTCLTFCFLAALFPAGVRAKVSAQAGGAATATPKTSPATHHAAASHLDPALLHPSTLKATAPGEYEVTFKTTAGDFVVKVRALGLRWAPTVSTIWCKHGFYNDAAFFRVVPGLRRAIWIERRTPP